MVTHSFTHQTEIRRNIQELWNKNIWNGVKNYKLLEWKLLKLKSRSENIQCVIWCVRRPLIPLWCIKQCVLASVINGVNCSSNVQKEYQSWSKCKKKHRQPTNEFDALCCVPIASSHLCNRFWSFEKVKYFLLRSFGARVHPRILWMKNSFEKKTVLFMMRPQIMRRGSFSFFFFWIFWTFVNVNLQNLEIVC